MSIILVRDDDANATTRPERLSRVYAPLFDAGIPVSFSVIPEVALDTRDPEGVRERFLDEAAEDTDGRVSLTPDSPLAAWLRRSSAEADVFVHGLSHRRLRGGTEFGELRGDEAARLIDRGLAIMTGALGRRPSGFVAPWDALSSSAVLAATAAFELVSTGWIDRSRLPLSAWPGFVAERLGRREALRVGRAWLVRHRGCRILASTPPGEVPAIVEQLARGADVTVIVLHHWQLWERGEPHPVVRALARALRGARTGNIRDTLRHLDARPSRGPGDLARGAAARGLSWISGARASR